MRLPFRRLTHTLLPALALSFAAALPAAYFVSGRREASGENYGRVALGFEANRGQTENSVDFIARGAGYALFLKSSEAVFVLKNQKAASQPKVLRMKLVGSDASATAVGADELEGKTNYLVGDDPSQWRTGVPTYGRVRYAGVYEGVDLVYYGNQRQLEYDFRVAPGADPRALGLKFEGADKVELDANGDLLLKLGEEVVRQPKPFAYQETAGARREVEAAYAVGADGLVRFAVGGYDPARALVIDPVLVYSTFLGGSEGDNAIAVAVDSAGNAYVAGATGSVNFPTVGPVQPAKAGNVDAFVTKLNAAGTAVVYSTYIGGGDEDRALGVAVDSAGSAYVTGLTISDNFPTAAPFKASKTGGASDAFVLKLNPAGSGFVYSTYLGGSNSDTGRGIAVDAAGSAYVTGYIASTDFPTANAVQPTKVGVGDDAFVTKLNPAGSALVYSTYLGGGSIDQGMGIALDPAGNAYVTGNTVSNDFPNVNAIQPTKRAANDAFVTKLNAAGSAFVYSTYLGGDDIDFGFGVAADSAGNAYVTGSTGSTNFPVANALQGAPGDSSDSKLDGFVTKLNPSGNAFVYSTYLGGQGSEESYAVAADSAGNAYVAGFVFMSPDFPVTNAVQCTLVEESNAFVTKLNASGSALAYSTFLGAFGTRALGVAVDSAGSAYVAGDTTSSHFPVVNPVQGAPGGFRNGPEGFVTKIADGPAPTSTIKFRQTLFQVNEDVRSVEMVVERTGDLSSAATVDYDTFGVGPTPATFIGDFTTGRGTLRFAPGQAEATVTALVSEDTYQELTEGLAVVLTNPTGGAALSCAAAGAAVQIADDDTSPQPSNNAIDDPATFVGQHYHDFLNRQADATGLNFWTSQITACGADAGCIDRARTNVSTAFALSIEFQQTGFYAFRFYKATFTDSAPRPRGMPRYLEFLRDSQELGRGVVVNQAGWEGVLEANKQEFARQWVQRPEFLARFPAGMSFDDYVAKLAANSGVTLTPTEINILFEGWSNDTEGRARTLRRVVELGSVYNRQFNAGFVLSQYIGYLRRDPNSFNDVDYTGFDFWLAKLDSFSLPGEDVRDERVALARVNRAEMVRAFILSAEYRQRFGRP